MKSFCSVHSKQTVTRVKLSSFVYCSLIRHLSFVDQLT